MTPEEIKRLTGTQYGYGSLTPQQINHLAKEGMLSDERRAAREAKRIARRPMLLRLMELRKP